MGVYTGICTNYTALRCELKGAVVIIALERNPRGWRRNPIFRHKVTAYGLDVQGSIPGKADMFLLATSFRSVLEPNQSPI
jgi:hypothetical protein